MRIAVIIPAFNVAPFLRQALQSVVGQTHSDWTLVVVDDGSTDATALVAAEFRDRRVTLLRQENAGVSAARNRGLRHAGSLPHDAVLFLDGDDWLAPDALARLGSALDTAPRAVAACGCYARVGIDGAIRRAAAPADGSVLEALLTRNLFANGGHLLIRREAVAAAGDFRTDLSYGEDWEYWARLALLGEFAAARSRAPLLFVRERSGGACLSRATDPEACRPALAAIHTNQEVARRLGAARLAELRRRSEAEIAWTVGRELIRHGHHRDGRRFLGRSLYRAPSLRRLVLIGLSCAGIGPFRRYRTAA